MKDLLKGKTFGEWTVVRTYSCRCGNGVLKPRAVVQCKHGHVSTIIQSALFSGEKKECLLCTGKKVRDLGVLETRRYENAMKNAGKIFGTWRIEAIDDKEIKYGERSCVAICTVCGFKKVTRLRYITKKQSAECERCKRVKKDKEMR